MKTKYLWVVLVSMLTYTTAPANPGIKHTEIRVTEKATESDIQRANEMQQRVNEIEAMDINSLSRTERKALKQELRGIKKEARQMDTVYVFGGGFLLLLIILIILL